MSIWWGWLNVCNKIDINFVTLVCNIIHMELIMEKSIRISIADRDAKDWRLRSADSLADIESPMDFHPHELKLFDGDIFTRDVESHMTSIVCSPVREAPNLPGILIMVGGNRYGAHPTNRNKHYYKCLPDDRRLPAFLVAYESKQNVFSKVAHNLYVTFKFHHWSSKHPCGTLVQNIGGVNNITSYYEYILYCKGLDVSTTAFSKHVHTVIKSSPDVGGMVMEIMRKNPRIENRETEHVITVDPRGATDFDDGFGFKRYDGYFIVSIYIANVSLWLDELELWDVFADRVATIYLPDRRRTMLPTILGDSLCSLHENKQRFALAMDLVVNDSGIIDVRFANVLISVSKNYEYDSPRVLRDNVYNGVVGACSIISRSRPDFRRGSHALRGPRDVVEYLMLLMNFECAKNLSAQDNNGIYRSTNFHERVKIPDTLSADVYSYLDNWNNYQGEYVHRVRTEHNILNLECYVHITSPIRRLVDLLNQIAFQKNNFLANMSEGALAFYDRWTTFERMDAINTDMRAINRVQNDCNLLKMCVTDPTVTEREYDGVMFGRTERSDGLFQYMVYLPELNMTSRMTHTVMMKEYSSGVFRIFMFMEEDSARKKIRVGMVGGIESGLK